MLHLFGPDDLQVEVSTCESNDCTSQLMSVNFHQLGGLDAKVSEKLCILAQVCSLIRSNWLCGEDMPTLCSLALALSLLHDDAVAFEDATLSHEHVDKFVDWVLQELPVDDTEELALTSDDKVIIVLEVSDRVQAVSTGVLHLHKLGRAE